MTTPANRPPLRIQILNVIGDFKKINELILEDFKKNKFLINRFIKDVEMCLDQLEKESDSKTVLTTLKWINKELQAFKELPLNTQTKLIWAEKALTWANILQHRAKLA